MREAGGLDDSESARECSFVRRDVYLSPISTEPEPCRRDSVMRIWDSESACAPSTLAKSESARDAGSEAVRSKRAACAFVSLLQQRLGLWLRQS